MVLSAGMCSTIFADQVTINGNLTYKTTESYTPASITVPANCDGGSRTITFATQTSDKYVPYAYNAGTNIKFEVHSQKPGASNPVYTTNTSMNNISYDQVAPLDGSFTYTLNDAAIAPSRYNYTCKVFVGTETTPAYEKDFNIASSGAVFPVGSVVAYMGNSGTVAALAESGWYKCTGQAVSTLSALTDDERTALTSIVGTHLPDLRGTFLRGLDEGRNYDDDRLTRTGGEGGNGVRSSQAESMRNHTHDGTTDPEGGHDHNITINSNGAHTHSVNAPSGWVWAIENTGGAVTSDAQDASPNELNLQSAGISSGGTALSAGAHTHTATIHQNGVHQHTFTTLNPNVGAMAGNENRPDNVAVYWLMRCR